MYIKFENDSWEYIMHESLRSDERTTPINEEIKNIFSHWCTKCKYGKCTGVRHSPCANCSVVIDYALGHISKSIPSKYSYDSSHLYTLYGKYCREFPDHLTVGEFGLPSICPDELCDCAPVHISCGKDNPEDCNECMDCWAKFGYDSPYRHADCNVIFKSSLEDFHSYFIKKLLIYGYSAERIEKQYIKDVLYLLKRNEISEDKAIRLITSMIERR